jgi:hypothetical protein
MTLFPKGEKANKTTDNRWHKDVLEALGCLLDSRAAQLRIAAALPVRSWEAIRKKTVKLRGRGVIVPESGHLQNGETMQDYLTRNPEAAASMALPISENSERTSVLKTNKPQLRRFNLARLQPIEFSLIENPKSSASTHPNTTSQPNADQPHDSARSIGIPPDSNGDNRE